MSSIKSDLKCPKCKKKNRIKIISEPTEDMIESIIDRSFFTFTCKECNEKVTIDYPFKLTTSKFIIYYTPTTNEMIKDKSKVSIKRVCDNYDDLKEKLLILSDGINDIVIEFIKSFMIRQVDEETKKDLKSIRYNCELEDKLVFSLVGTNKNVACPKIFYDEILRRSKRKKIKYAIEINELNYNKYFKMR